jgi:cysteine desulfurase / selenocysteine lyase
MNIVNSPVLDIQKIREEFPVLHQHVHGKPLVYFDNAATSQKPKQVIQALVAYYEKFNANIHRGIHSLAEKATREFEETRDVLQQFIHARDREEIIFVRGVTEAINLVATSYGNAFLRKGDEIIISGLEHHSNIVPWQMLCERTGALLKVIPVTEVGDLDLETFHKLLSSKTKLVAVNHVSNSLGTINPIKTMIDAAHQAGAVILIDGAQAAAHEPINVQELDCDFYCLSAHKMYGPTGVGILYGKKQLLEQMPPYMGGGEMIKDVSFSKTTYNDLPYKFEAGTPNIGDVVAFKEAVHFINRFSKAAIAAHELQLLSYTIKGLKTLKDVRLIGTSSTKVGVQSFVINGIHHFDVGQMLDARGVAVRTGHHCTQPLMEQFGLEGTVRASFAIYNTTAEVDQMLEGIERIINFMK